MEILDTEKDVSSVVTPNLSSNGQFAIEAALMFTMAASGQ
jgi:hypothetical protein